MRERKKSGEQREMFFTGSTCSERNEIEMLDDFRYVRSAMKNWFFFDFGIPFLSV